MVTPLRYDSKTKLNDLFINSIWKPVSKPDTRAHLNPEDADESCVWMKKGFKTGEGRWPKLEVSINITCCTPSNFILSYYCHNKLIYF